MMSNSTMVTAFGSSSFSSYVQYVVNIPRLSSEDEQLLVDSMINHNCKESAQQIIIHHLRFVLFLARRFNEQWNLPIQDLVQEGNVALMHAVSNYDPVKSNGARVATFASSYILSALKEYVRDNLKIVRIGTSKAVKKALNHIRKYLTGNVLSQLQAETMASDLGIRVEDVRTAEMQSSINSVPDSYFYADDSPAEIIDDRYDPAILVQFYQEETTAGSEVSRLLSTLGDRDRDILERRYLSPSPEQLEVIANDYGVSLQRISQLEKKAIKKLQSDCYLK